MELNYKILEYLNTLGYETEEELSEFLSDKPRKTYDPFLLLNMDAGVDLILSAIEDDETICVYGDYDADGITSVTLLTDVLSELTEKVFYYIPSRFDEGYGLNREALYRIREAGAGLVITVDCGITAVEEAEACFRKAYDMVPNRLYPLYLLANLYFSTGEAEKGVAVAWQLLDQEPKVMSDAVREMKAEMKEKIGRYGQVAP